jgi:hypothetical protein
VPVSFQPPTAATSLRDRFFRSVAHTRRRAPDLAEDLHEEVVDETWTIICCSPGLKYDPARGSVWKFLVGRLMNAIKTIRAVYRPVGSRTRSIPRRRSAKVAANEMPAEMSLDSGTTAQAEVINSAVIEKSVEQAERIEKSVEAVSLIEAAPADIRPALELIYQEGSGVAEAAQALGISRFTLRRRLDEFAKQHAELAA